MASPLESGINREQAFPEGVTRRPVNPGAEKWLGEKIHVLDHGFVYLVDYMGDDQAVEQAARVSYGGGTRKVSETTGLIRYLMRHEHMTPFEMAEFKFHAKMPIFVARQWIRHRTASVNEISARYSILSDEFYVPDLDHIAAQSRDNRQGRSEVFDADQAREVQRLLILHGNEANEHYEYFLNDDGTGKPQDPERDMLARELARMDLTLNHYTEWYWKVNFRNLAHFLRLRKDAHAQYEIRVYADAMGDIMKDAMPISWQAFVDYNIESTSFSRQEMQAVGWLIQSLGVDLSDEQLRAAIGKSGVTNKRETEEFIKKMQRALKGGE